MIIDTKLEMLADIFLSTEKVSLWVYSPSWDLLFSNSPWQNELHNIFYLGKNIELINSSPNAPVTMLEDDFGLSWIAHRYTGDEYTKGFYILGPILITQISERILKERMSIKDMSISSQIKFINLSSNIPIMPKVYFTHLNSMFYYALFHETMSPDTIYNTSIEISLTNKAAQNSSISSSEKYHGSYALEQKILENVTSGNIYYEHTDFTQNPYASVGTLAIGDPVRQIKNELIVYTALVTRAAIRGGLPSEKAYNLSDYFIQEIEAGNSGNELYVLAQNMFSTFVHQVHALHNQTKYSYAVSESLAMLHSNIPISIDIKDIAKALGYSTYYLTRQIIKETGKSYKEHLAIAKIEYAKKQLLDPGTPISSISEELKYSTPSYFSAQFKEIAGCTPKEYRQRKTQS